jgi:succinate-acetate transporter protein
MHILVLVGRAVFLLCTVIFMVIAISQVLKHHTSAPVVGTSILAVVFSLCAFYTLWRGPLSKYR